MPNFTLLDKRDSQYQHIEGEVEVKIVAQGTIAAYVPLAAPPGYAKVATSLVYCDAVGAAWIYGFQCDYNAVNGVVWVRNTNNAPLTTTVKMGRFACGSRPRTT